METKIITAETRNKKNGGGTPTGRAAGILRGMVSRKALFLAKCDSGVYNLPIRIEAVSIPRHDRRGNTRRRLKTLQKMQDLENGRK